MAKRKKVSPREAQALRRPRGGAVIVAMGENTYEVLDFPGGGRRVFRLELEYIEPTSPEYHAVVDVVEKKVGR